MVVDSHLSDVQRMLKTPCSLVIYTSLKKYIFAKGPTWISYHQNHLLIPVTHRAVKWHLLLKEVVSL
jgi:hypothetical protein